MGQIRKKLPNPKIHLLVFLFIENKKKKCYSKLETETKNYKRKKTMYNRRYSQMKKNKATGKT